MVVVLPAPLGPRNPVTLPRVDRDGQVVDRHPLAVALDEAVRLDHELSSRVEVRVRGPVRGRRPARSVRAAAAAGLADGRAAPPPRTARCLRPASTKGP